jgi:hypothetical protein
MEWHVAPLSSQHGEVPDVAEAAPQPAPAPQKLAWRARRSATKRDAKDRVVFRRGGPLALWWLWVAFAVFNFFDVAVQDHDYFSLELTAGLLAVTAIAFACALRPRVVADHDGIRVYNPYRDHVARWGAVNGVFLGDSVEVACARPKPKSDKTIYCWALYAGRRSQRRSKLRSDRHGARVTGRTVAEVSSLRQPDAVNVMVAELGRRSDAAKRRGVAAATLESGWAWLPITTLLVPAAALLGLVLARG